MGVESQGEPDILLGIEIRLHYTHRSTENDHMFDEHGTAVCRKPRCRVVPSAPRPNDAKAYVT